MSDVSTADHKVEQPQASASPDASGSTGKLPWVLLALWAIWLAVLIVLSCPELGRKRLPHDIAPLSPDEYQIRR